MTAECRRAWLLAAVLLAVGTGPASSQTFEGELGPGEKHTYPLPAPSFPGSVMRATAEQRGVDLALVRLGTDGTEVTLVDSPTGRRGIERLLVEPPWTSGERIEVRALERRAPAGHYRLVFTEVPADSETLAAERLVLRADVTYGRGGSDGRREALAALYEARRLWNQLGDRREEARTAARAGTFERTTGSPQRAAASYERALELWLELGEREELPPLWNDLGFVRAQLSDRPGAFAAYAEAVAVAEALGDDGSLGRTLNNQGLLHHNGGDPRAARPFYERALPLLDRAGYPALAATVRTNLAAVLEATGEPEAALAAYAEAVATQRELGNTREEARAEGNRAFLHRSLGRLQEALEGHRRALELQRREDGGGEPAEVARSLSNLGELYLALGEPERAAPLVEESLGLRRQAGDRRGEAYSHHNLGAIQRARGDGQQARASFESAIEIFRTTADRRGLANSLRVLGVALAGLGEGDAARARFNEALALQTAIDDRRGRGETLRREAELELAAGAAERARAGFAAALELARETRHALAEIEARVGLARTERALGHPDEAQIHVAEALALVDRLRSALVTPELRAPFVAPRSGATELAVDLAWEAHERNPAAGRDQRAFELAHDARARSLAEAIADSSARASAAPDLLDRRRAAAERLSLKTFRLGDRSGSEAEAAMLGREVESARQEIEALDAEMARTQPRLAAWSRPHASKVAEVQELLDPETLLLFFSLGSERSLVFALTRTTFAGHELPPRSEIERGARDLHQRFRTLEAGAPRGAEAQAAAAIVRPWLEPVADDLARARYLIVIPDGDLGLVPFAALPTPGTNRPLVEGREIVVVPSASVLAALRARRAERGARAEGDVLVLADPVFDHRDPRAPKVPADSGTLGERLVWSGEEAAAVARAWPAGQVQLRLGREATLDVLTDHPLGHYRILHLATHGLVDTTRGDRTGLLFSAFDTAGRPRPAFLGLAAVHGLQLAADLVVLSGCRTALGREVRNEGPMGLARGFLYAGADRVVASLWPVEDRATAELMARFHRQLSAGAVSPAAALAQAQRELRALPRWSDPYYWSGFVLYGDGR